MDSGCHVERGKMENKGEEKFTVVKCEGHVHKS